MTAYAIFIRDETTDQAELDTYGSMVAAARVGHDITPLVRYGPFEVMEGEPAEGVVLLQFPSMAAAKAWYDSPLYQEALAHRLAGARYRVIFAEGV